jgi:hypothetical protein
MARNYASSCQLHGKYSQFIVLHCFLKMTERLKNKKTKNKKKNKQKKNYLVVF